MRFYFVLALVLAVSVVHAQTPQIKYFVNDYAGIFSTEETAQLDALLNEIQQSGVAQYAIVTINSTAGVPIETYAIELAQGNLGDTEKDNGLLLLIAVDDRAYRFEVGSGLEGTINDAKAGRIGRTYLVPYFKEGQYGQGTVAASTAIRDLLVQGQEPVLVSEEVGSPKWFFLALAILLLAMIIISALKKKNKTNKYYDAALAAANIASASDWWRRGGGGGSGGFGGFGGGGFSGGGASGGW